MTYYTITASELIDWYLLMSTSFDSRNLFITYWTILRKKIIRNRYSYCTIYTQSLQLLYNIYAIVTVTVQYIRNRYSYCTIYTQSLQLLYNIYTIVTVTVQYKCFLYSSKVFKQQSPDSWRLSMNLMDAVFIAEIIIIIILIVYAFPKDMSLFAFFIFVFVERNANDNNSLARTWYSTPLKAIDIAG
jgi:hypothetical protein